MRKHTPFIGIIALLSICLFARKCQPSAKKFQQFKCGQITYTIKVDSIFNAWTCMNQMKPHLTTAQWELLIYLEENQHLTNDIPDSIGKVINELQQQPIQSNYLAMAKFLKFQSVGVNRADKNKTLTLLYEAVDLLTEKRQTKCDSLELCILNSYLSYYLDRDHADGENAMLHTQKAIAGYLNFNRVKEAALEYTNLAKLCTHYKNNELAIENLKKVLCIWQNVGVHTDEELFIYYHTVQTLAILYNNQGKQHIYQKEYGQATTIFKESLSILSQLMTTSQTAEFTPQILELVLSDLVAYIGEIYQVAAPFLAEKPDLHLFQPLRTLLDTLDSPTVQMNKLKTYPLLAHMTALTGDIALAEKQVNEGLKYAFKDNYKDSIIQHNPQNILDTGGFIRGLQAKADIYKLKYEAEKDITILAQALTIEQQALAFIERTRQTLILDETKEDFMANSAFFYDKAYQTALQLYNKTKQQIYLNQAIQISDQGKSRVLRQEIQNKINEEKLIDGHPQKQNLAQQKQMKNKLWQLQQAYYAVNNPPPTSKIALLRDSILLVNQQLQTLKTALTANNRLGQKYALSQSSGKIPDFQHIQTNWLDAKTAILMYEMGYETAHLIVLTKTKQALVKLPMDSTIFYLNDLLAETLEQELAHYANEAAQIYQQILAPAMEGIQKEGIKKLVIIPDGIINSIAFPALLSESIVDSLSRNYANLPYLIKDYDIAYLPALALQQFNDSPKNPLINFAAFVANPTPENKNNPHEQAISFSQLEAIHKIDSSTQKITNTYFNPADLIRDAKKNEFIKIAPTAKVFHVALHGIFDPAEYHLNNYLAFIPTEKDNGALTMGEIYGLAFQADLAFLASCNSGKGKVHTTEGVMSMERSFLYAGCRSVLSTLHPVEEERIVEISAYFYDYYKGKKYTGSTSLASAQRAYLNKIDLADKNRAHPSNWANYRYIGINVFNPSNALNQAELVSK